MCEDELICDFAETYHILDYKGLSPKMAAVLCVGLRNDSRVKMKISESKLTLDQMLFARMIDELSFQSWAQTKDGQKNRNRPKSLLKELTEEKEEEYEKFATADDFLSAWENITRENDA